MVNIYRDFCNELGYTNATNQYLELTRRKYIRNSGDNDLQSIFIIRM